MTSLVECQCNLHTDMNKAGEILALCHHSPHPDIMENIGTLYKLLGSFDYRLEMEQLLTRPVNEAIEYYIRTTVGADYPMLNQAERDILATGFLRHYCIALQAMLGENLNTIKTRDQG